MKWLKNVWREKVSYIYEQFHEGIQRLLFVAVSLVILVEVSWEAKSSLLISLKSLSYDRYYGECIVSFNPIESIS